MLLVPVRICGALIVATAVGLFGVVIRSAAGVVGVPATNALLPVLYVTKPASEFAVDCGRATTTGEMMPLKLALALAPPEMFVLTTGAGVVPSTPVVGLLTILAW